MPHSRLPQRLRRILEKTWNVKSLGRWYRKDAVFAADGRCFMPSSPFAEKSVAEGTFALMGMPVTTVGRRRIAVDLEQDKYWRVGVFQRASRLGKVGLIGHFVRDRNTAAAGDNPQINALARMRGLAACFAIKFVVHTDDRKIFWLHDSDGRERADAHEQIAIAGHHHNATIGLGKGETETGHRGPTHRSPKQECVRRLIGKRADILRRTGQAGNNQKIAWVAEKFRNGFPPIEAGRDFLCI